MVKFRFLGIFGGKKGRIYRALSNFFSKIGENFAIKMFF
jgi:hypothetical protein